MSQDASHHQEQQHGLDQVPIPALPPVFAHVVISEHYEEGRFSSRLEAEIADILWNCQPLEDPEEERHIPLTDEALAALNNLNCIALIQGGQVLSLLDIEHTPTPMTTIQRAHLYHSAARTLLEAIAAILKDQDNRQ
jgi:hypothetical protein